MALVYVEQVEHLDVEEMQETHEEEIKLLNEVEKLIILLFTRNPIIFLF